MAAFASRDKPAFAEHWAKLLQDVTGLKQAVLVDDEVVGNVVSWNSDGKREVGYWIDRAHWGRGVATDALSAFLRLERTRPLYAGVARHNAASMRVLQKCGFTFLPSTNDKPGDANGSHVILVLTEDKITEVGKDKE